MIAKLGGSIAAVAMLLALEGGALAATTIADLYQARSIVTGTRAATRARGLAECLEDVLVKVSGDPRLIGDKRVAALARKAAGFVREYRYHDRMSGIPYHDEQGSRDRPFDLIVDFDPPKIDAALRSLGREPWIAPRPRLVAFIAVSGMKRSFVLAADGSAEDDREGAAILAAAARRGMPLALPNVAALEVAGVTVESLAAADPAGFDTRAKSLGGDLALVGSMAWSEPAIVWIAEWRLRAAGKTHQWQTRSATFDDSFRSAMGGAALILSGQGQPK